MSVLEPKDDVKTCDMALARRVGGLLICAGVIGAVFGVAIDPHRFAFAWLVAFMFFVSLCFGALFLVIAHHLFDAGWSVSIRRICEHVACFVFPWMALAFVPLLFLGGYVYPWGQTHNAGQWGSSSGADGGVRFWVWCGLSVLIFGAWWWLAHSLRRLSLEQDKTGEAGLTHRLRRYSAGGAFVFAVTVTGAATLWMKGIDRGWDSAIYGACFFSSCGWFAIAVAWLLSVVLGRNRALRTLLGPVQFQSLGALLFAFTLLHAYMHYSQYFVIWNANLPEETSWYILREQGTWFHIGLVLVFGHFLLPFLVLLRSDWKLRSAFAMAACAWAWPMHYLDMAFNILPVTSPEDFPLGRVWMDLSCLALVGGCLSRVFVRDFCRHPAFPLRDPRLNEALAGRDGHCLGSASAEAGPGMAISDNRSTDTGGS
jgi:hypothetical protein